MTSHIEKCYKSEIFIPRIEQTLGVRLPKTECHIVSSQGMKKVMGKHGWSKNQSEGVVGFHVQNNVYVLRSAPWTTLHELIHQAGINADRINRWLAEGLTEAIARQLKTSPDEHRPTYPKETKWVQELLGRLQMSPVQLGRLIAQSNDPVYAVADLLIAKGVTTRSRAQLVADLRPQKPNAPSLNITGKITRIAQSSTREAGAGIIMILGGLLLLLTSSRRKNVH
jgi:hypothetical protein